MVENRPSGPPVIVAWIMPVLLIPDSCDGYRRKRLLLPRHSAAFIYAFLFATFLNYPLQLHRHPLYHGCVNHLIAPVRLCPLILLSQTADLCLVLPFVDLSSLFFSKVLAFPSAFCTPRVLYSGLSPQY